MSNEYIVNERGAKIYLDESKQPRLVLTGGSITQRVLSVGFTGSMSPMATIDEGDEVVAYILPKEYLGWCQTCVGMAISGTNMFPADVVFSLVDGKYYADIL